MASLATTLSRLAMTSSEGMRIPAANSGREAARMAVAAACSQRTLGVPYPKVDRVIAMALREDPATIWPSRYHRDVPAGNPRLWRRWINVKSTTDEDGETVNPGAAD